MEAMDGWYFTRAVALLSANDTELPREIARTMGEALTKLEFRRLTLAYWTKEEDTEPTVVVASPPRPNEGSSAGSAEWHENANEPEARTVARAFGPNGRCSLAYVGQASEEDVASLFELLTPAVARHDAAGGLKRELLEARRLGAVGQAIVGVAHDFNNALHAVSCIADVMLLGLSADSEGHRDASAIKAAAARGATLTRQLVTLAKQRRRADERCSLDALLTELGPILSRILGSELQLLLELDAGLSGCLVPRAWLEQLLLEAALEARAQITGAGSFRVRATFVESGSPDAQSVVELDLQGLGSAGQKVLLDSEPLLRCVGELQKAGVVILSAGVAGSGLRLRCHMARATKVPSKGALEPALSPVADRGQLALLVEPDPTTRRASKMILERQGLRVMEATGVASALAMAQTVEGELALLVSELALGDGDGGALFAAMRGRIPGLVALFVSSRGTENLAELELPQSSFSCLPKPCRLSEIQAETARLLDQRALVGRARPTVGR